MGGVTFLEAMLENSYFTMNTEKISKYEKWNLFGTGASFQGGAHVAPPKPPEIRQRSQTQSMYFSLEKMFSL